MSYSELAKQLSPRYTVGPEGLAVCARPKDISKLPGTFAPIQLINITQLIGGRGQLFGLNSTMDSVLQVYPSLLDRNPGETKASIQWRSIISRNQRRKDDILPQDAKVLIDLTRYLNDEELQFAFWTIALGGILALNQPLVDLIQGEDSL